MKFEAEIGEDALSGLSKAIAEQLRNDPQKRALVTEFAMRQMLDWLAGRAPHQSLTEQHTAWLTALLPVLFPDDAPSAERLFNDFSIPYGRAAYIARVLLEKQQSQWRLKGRQTLLAALRLKQAEAKANIDNGDGTRHVPVALDKAAYLELAVLCELILTRNPTLEPPVARSRSLGKRNVDVPSNLFEPLFSELRG